MIMNTSHTPQEINDNLDEEISGIETIENN